MTTPEPTTSWIVNNSLPLSPPINSVLNARPSNDSDARSPEPQPGPEPRGKPGEKNRLSLAFLKRASFFAPTKTADAIEGAPRPDTSKSHHKTTSSTHHGHGYDGSNDFSSQPQQTRTYYNSPAGHQADELQKTFSFDKSREPEATSRAGAVGPPSRDGSSTTAVTRESSGGPNRFGSVKKRLSAFNLGRKASKQDGWKVQPVMEE